MKRQMRWIKLTLFSNIKTIKSISYGLLARSIEILVPIVLAPLFISEFGLGQYAAFAYFSTSSIFFSTFIHFGLEARNLGIARSDSEHDNLRNLFHQTFWVQNRLVILSALLFVVFVNFTTPVGQEWYLALNFFAGSVFVGLFPSWILAIKEQIFVYFKIVLFSRLFYFLAAIASLVFNWSLVFISFLFLISSLLSLGMAYLHLRRQKLLLFAPMLLSLKDTPSSLPYSILPLANSCFILIANVIIQLNTSQFTMAIYLLTLQIMIATLSFGQTITFSIFSFAVKTTRKLIIASLIVLSFGTFFGLILLIFKYSVSYFLLSASDKDFITNLTVLAIAVPFLFVANNWIQIFFVGARRRRYLLTPLPVYAISVSFLFIFRDESELTNNPFGIFLTLRLFQVLMIFLISMRNYRHIKFDRV